MKKVFISLTLVLLIILIAVEPAVAQTGKLYIKGEVTNVGSDTLTVQTRKGDTFVVTIPEGIGTNTFKIGDSVLIKANAAEGDTWLVEFIKKVGRGSGSGGNEREGFKENSAYCSDGKQVKPHPLAPKIAQRFGIPEELVMGYFCDGYSIGAIMLAIKTCQLEGVTATIGEMLENRETGESWGQIWSELLVIQKEKFLINPSELHKKPDHTGPKD